MLPRKHRLTADKDITRVLRKGRAVFTNLLGVKALPAEGGVTRTAVVVGTKVHKRATKRNLIKRRVREVLRVLIPKLKASADLVIMARDEAVGRSQADLKTALEYSLRKLNLLPLPSGERQGEGKKS
jgi:ribonuclease P protein component